MSKITQKLKSKTVTAEIKITIVAILQNTFLILIIMSQTVKNYIFICICQMTNSKILRGMAKCQKLYKSRILNVLSALYHKRKIAQNDNFRYIIKISNYPNKYEYVIIK